MRHRKKITKLSRTNKHRVSMLNTLATDIILKGRVKTTTVKAKVVRSYVERLITYGKKNTLASRRNALRFLKSKDAFYKLFNQVAPIYTDRNGGYTRIYKLDSTRKGDNSDMSLIELVDYSNILPSKQEAAEALVSESPKPTKKKAKEKVQETEAVEVAEVKTEKATDVKEELTTDDSVKDEKETKEEK